MCCAADIPPWYVGGYWALPLQWLVNAIINNEFQDGEQSTLLHLLGCLSGRCMFRK